ncbi:MAG: hypothetical protein JXK07_03905 [Spirochaetes bacterium]|nr:hypothetical protein [Spirochaetota bacterium]MBN2770339.1 hypothetical protein [Spirochaetota bacterium]
MQTSAKSVVKHKIISTQCQSCGHTFNLSSEKINSFQNGMTHCPSCSNPIKITFCPECNISYSISTANLKPNRYATKCKQCGYGFYIDIPESPEQKHKMPFITRVTEPIEKAPVSKKPVTTLKPETKKNESVSSSEVLKKMEPPRPQNLQETSLSEVFKLISKAFNLQNFSLSLISIISMISIFLISTNIITFLTPPPQVSGNYLLSFLNIIPPLLVFAVYTAFASVSAKRILINNEVQLFNNTTGLELFANSLFASLFGGAPALIAIQTLLVFITRIPDGGTLIFALTFLPIYIGAILTVLTLTIGIWFLPSIYAAKIRTPLGHLSEFIRFIKKHNINLIINVFTLFMVAGALSTALFFVHATALSLAETIISGAGNSNTIETLSNIPVLFTSFARFSFFGENSSLLNYLTAQTSIFSTAGGIIIGICLSLITLVLYSLILTIITVSSTVIYKQLEYPSSDPKIIPGKGIMILLILVYFAVLAMKAVFS